MTERLYYTDATTVRFTATVVASDAEQRRVVLDRTAFYPTSGGQPHDLGQLGGIAVVDVIDEDDTIAHVLAEPLMQGLGQLVEGHVDAARRFHHMQQHTGQHLLSAVLADGYGWPTVSVHFGDATNTVDVAAASVSVEQLVEIEERVNRLVAEDRAVAVSFEDAARATGLRKPSDREGTLRIVTIDGLDRSACGGTHVTSTGAIGAILLRRMERTKGNTRIEFVCGLRAVARARTDATLLSNAARLFTTSPEELSSLIEASQARLADLERERKRLVTRLAEHDARTLWSSTAADANGLRWISLDAVEGSVQESEPMVRALLALGPCVVLANSPSTKGLLLGASESSGLDAGQTLRAALQAVGGRGGGSPRLAQGAIADMLMLADVRRACGFPTSTP
jgi:alanyl-tRNA synthetase